MRTFLLLCFLLASNLTFSQSEKEVAEAVQKMRSALLAEDVPALKSLTSENLSYGHSGGVIETQAEFLAVFASKKSDYQKWDVSNQTISFHGKELAMVRQNVKAEILSTENGTLNNLNIGLLMVWVKEKGTWKLLARQAFRIPQS
jgi:ketosteroid isomerase-like protein